MSRFVTIALVVAALCLVFAVARQQMMTPSAWLVGTWRVKEIQGRPVVRDATITVYPDGSVSGKSACHEFGGRSQFSGARLLPSPIWGNLTSCLEQEGMHETDLFMNALGISERARLDSEGVLVFVSRTNEVLLTFTRIGDAPAQPIRKAPPNGVKLHHEFK